MLDTSYQFRFGGMCADKKGGFTCAGVFYLNYANRCSIIQINDTIPNCSWDKATLPVIAGYPYPPPVIIPFKYPINTTVLSYPLTILNPTGSFDLCVSSAIIENEISNGLPIFPNPTNNLTNISSPNFINSTLVIYDITGRTLSQQPFNTKATIDISQLTNGIYIAEVKDKEGRSLKGKVVKE